MPYTKQERRDRVDVSLDAIIHEIKSSDFPDGEVNYAITRITVGSLWDKTTWKYFNLVRIIGTFICAALEAYFRIGRKTEDRAIQRNGDIQEYV